MLNAARRLSKQGVFLGLTLAFAGGCANDLPSSVVTEAPAARLEDLTSLDRRVAETGFRLARANVDYCARRAMSAGWALHAANQYSEELRPIAVARFGLAGDLPGVLAAPEEGPAAQVGLRVGDVVLAVNDTLLAQGESDQRPSFDGLHRNLAVIDDAFKQGPTRLQIRRGQERLAVTLRPVAACHSTFQVDVSEDLRARANGDGVFITSALARFAATDADLAVILSHELAHNVLGHRAGAGAPAGNDREREADRVGLYMLRTAGYDIGAAPDFWRRFGAASWRARQPQWGHPSAPERARTLDGLVAEISAPGWRDPRVRP